METAREHVGRSVGRRVLFIGSLNETVAEIRKTEMEGVKFEGTEVRVEPWALDIPSLEYHLFEHIATSRILEIAVRAEEEGFDAVIIGCFYDPGLREARELVSIPVVGVGEATMHLASILSSRFSVIVGRRKWISKMADNARLYGVDSKIASWRVLDLSVPEMADVERTKRGAIYEARKAVEMDLADAVILGCTALTGMGEEIQTAIGVPVLDPVIVGLKFAEMLADLWRKTKTSHGKKYDYEAPPTRTIYWPLRWQISTSRR